ncbi:MAG: D-sedoheptulose 7-phosphate isomerase [Bacteroidales bacterium]|jgi:D-sedoheptulose 7-phosphate isomerase|nr:D-sedoheptulose 7-phosphate isomerase [Bacteroidales bacterium]MDD2688053.1 D-sedoheptulose 7-phosphate isomerase [Bacteroidales bacterium]MDD3329742.1 D-sedoheptulose 7-phosphate isomerase [Bacteroidales bacterium]MDD3690468.1 D-sedoheptulose 7-phosphate isomerase [Bacteroidales bacterium]MDD4044341.1 D-sedoheptulose 7-phosphate isomerase [Bacteroidales bacterium]
MDLKQSIINSINVKEKVLQNSDLLHRLEDAITLCVESLKSGGTLFFCGNGGSAADAQHLAAELSGRFNYDRNPLSAEALHCNTSFLTAVANDYGFDYVFSRLLQANAKEGDVLIGLSTSGNSSNMIQVFQTANEMNVKSIALTGLDGGKLKNYADILLNVPSNQTPRIQESHILIGHILCEYIEKIIFPMK